MKIALSPLEKFRAGAKVRRLHLEQAAAHRQHRGDQALQTRDATSATTGRSPIATSSPISPDVVRRFDPLVVVFTGGEPMLRRDLVPIVKSIKELPGFRYMTLLTPRGLPLRAEESRSWSPRA